MSKNTELLKAIIARINGEWDNPYLVRQGPMTCSTVEDILYIAKQCK